MKTKEINDKIVQAYEKYVPKNITLEQFAQIVEQHPDFLDAIGGNFSMFSPELSIALKNKEIPEEELRKILLNSVTEETKAQISQNYAKMYEEIICSDDDILRAAWTFKTLNRKQKQDLAIKIIDAISERFGIENKPKIVYADKKIQLPFKEQVISALVYLVLTIAEIKEKAQYLKDYGGYYNKVLNTIAILKTDEFPVFMLKLSHEYGHFIDENYPDLGMLGSQISSYSEKVYSSRTDNDAYATNPTEASSYNIGHRVFEHIKKVLAEQAIKKPALYVESLKTLIGYNQLKMAGLRMKHSKVFKKAEKTEREYHELKNKLLKELFPGIDTENLPVEQVVAVSQKLRMNPKLKAAEQQYKQATAEIPKEYTELARDVDRCNRLIEQYNSNQEDFSKAVRAYWFLYKEY